MRTWDDYKKMVKTDSLRGLDLAEAEQVAQIIGAIIKRRLDLGLSQEALAAKCNMERTSITRFESFRVIPNLLTIIRIAQAVGLKITVETDDNRQST